MKNIIKIGIGVGIFIFAIGNSYAEQWIATAYCSCIKCCGKCDGITASGKRATSGTVAVNWLPFGTQLRVDNKIYTVEDRGARSQFGSKYVHKKRIDIWMPSHSQAIKFGRRIVNMEKFL